MNEFDLQAWEREIDAWQRRLARQDAPAMRAELDHLRRDVGDLREHPETEAELRGSVERRFARLLALYDVIGGRGSA